MSRESNALLFKGPFAESLYGYIKEKQALGIKFQVNGEVLMHFDRYTQLHLINNELSQELVENWIVDDGTLSKATIRLKTIIIRGFLEYSARLGYTNVIPTYLPLRSKNTYIPYIFSKNEIQSLINKADELKPVSKISYKHLVVPMMLRILYGCGLRISEVANLRINDVNLNAGILQINNSKKDKSRKVPMSDTLIKICCKYSKQVHQNSKSSDYFFSNVNNRKYSADRFYKSYRKLLWEIGISHGGRGKGPRIHDLRHTFSVHSLKQMVDNGIDLNVALPYLSAYLGHNSLSETQYYLRLVVEIFPEITKKIEIELGEIIPTMCSEEKYYEE